MPDDFYGPTGPGWAWPLAGVAALVAVGAWIAWIWWSTRGRRGRRVGARGVEDLRFAALADVDALAAEHAAGRLTAREVFQHLSPLMRHFVHRVTGRPVHLLPLGEFRAADDPALVAAIAWLYPEEFALDAPGAVADGLAGARSYIRSLPAANGAVR